jgi:hypothetical protein
MCSVTEGITEEHLQDIYSDTYIARAAHDGRAASPVIHPAVVYLSAWVKGSFAGAFLVVKHSAIDFELHSLLKRQFISSSRELGQHCLAWVFGHESVLRATVYVMEGLESARNYCIKQGFKLEGVKRNACMKNQEAKDIYILGIIREEWRASWVS